MPGIDAVNNAQQQQTQSAANVGKAGYDALDKSAFLELLITQMNYQDPMSPMENEQFIAQLAEFSALEQMQNINNNLEQSLESDYLVNQSLNNSIVTTLIGKDVIAQSNAITLPLNKDIELGISVPQAMRNTTIDFYGADGSLKKSVTLGNISAGSHDLSANDLDVPDGSYSVEISGFDGEGQKIYGDLLLRGRISGVNYQEGTATLMLGSTRLQLGDVIEIQEPAR